MDMVCLSGVIYRDRGVYDRSRGGMVCGGGAGAWRRGGACNRVAYRLADRYFRGAFGGARGGDATAGEKATQKEQKYGNEFGARDRTQGARRGRDQQRFRAGRGKD